MDRASESLMTALGFSRETSRLYDRLVPLSGQTLEELHRTLGVDVDVLRRLLAPLAESEIVREVDEALVVLPPAEAISRMLLLAADRAQVAHDRLINISKAMPHLAGLSARPHVELIAEEAPIDGEVFASRHLPDTVHALVGQTVGDLLWLRPDQWTLPWETQLVELVGEAVARGRRVRSIYPLRAMSESAVALSVRVEAGEEIRIVPNVPTRMLVIGASHALIPEPLGTEEATRIMVRQRGIVDALVLLFEELWRRASPLTDLQEIPRRETARRFLLEQLALGAQDEQIARRLGMSLRTVRRRVAELMSELGAESRFQAGVEAARRGWL